MYSRRGTVTGWGHTGVIGPYDSFADVVPILGEVDLPIQPDDECRNNHGRNFVNGTFCAGRLTAR